MDAAVSQNLGVLLGVGAVILLLGVALGIPLGIFCYKSRRQQERMKGWRSTIAGFSQRLTRLRAKSNMSN